MRVRRLLALCVLVAGSGYSLYMAWSMARHMLALFGPVGGLGFSIDVSIDSASSLLVTAIGVVVNLCLAKWARRYGTIAVRLRWFHLAATVGLQVFAIGLLLLANSPLQLDNAWVTMLKASFVMMALVMPAQILAIAALAALLIDGRPDPRPTG